MVSLESASAPPLTCGQMTGGKKTHRQTAAGGGRSTASVTRGMQVQARQRFTPPRTARIRSQMAAPGGEDVEKSDLPHCCSVISFTDVMDVKLTSRAVIDTCHVWGIARGRGSHTSQNGYHSQFSEHPFKESLDESERGEWKSWPKSKIVASGPITSW